MTLTATPAQLSLTVGQTARLQLVVTLADGTPAPTGDTAAVAWPTTEPMVVVATSHDVRANGVGDATITGTLGPARVDIPVQCQPSPDRALSASRRAAAVARSPGNSDY